MRTVLLTWRPCAKSQKFLTGGSMAYSPKRPPLDPCPVEAVVAIVAGKWKARILLEVAGAPLTFGKLRRALPGITQQVLAAQLRALEDHGVVSRTPAASDPLAGSLYAMTAEGRSLLPVLDTMACWGLGRLERAGLRWDGAPRARIGPVGAHA
jgi:DNA-binding HxlR family transcriptional regulator